MWMQNSNTKLEISPGQSSLPLLKTELSFDGTIDPNNKKAIVLQKATDNGTL
jgi:hypothetical protein